jgi:hypothetical protein
MINCLDNYRVPIIIKQISSEYISENDYFCDILSERFEFDNLQIGL